MLFTLGSLQGTEPLDRELGPFFEFHRGPRVCVVCIHGSRQRHLVSPSTELDYNGCARQQLNLPHEETTRTDKGMLAGNADAPRTHLNFHEQWRFHHVGSLLLQRLFSTAGARFATSKPSLE